MRFIQEIKKILVKNDYICTVTKLFESPPKKNRYEAIALTLPHKKNKILYDCSLKYKKGFCDIYVKLDIDMPNISGSNNTPKSLPIADHTYQNVPIYAVGALLYTKVTNLILGCGYHPSLIVLIEEDSNIVDNEHIVDFFKVANNKGDIIKYYELINVLRKVSKDGFTEDIDNLAKNSAVDILSGYNFIKSNI